MYVGITFPFEHGLITRWQTLWKLYDYRNLTNSRNVSSLRAQWCAVWCSRALNQVEMLELRMPLVPQNRPAKCNMQRVRSRAQRTTRVAGEWMWRPYAPLSCKESGESDGNVFRGGKYIFITRWRVLLMYQSIPKPPIPPPPRQSPGIWLMLSSIQWGIWPKRRPAQWGIWLSCQNVCQRSEAKGFRNSLIQHVSRIHGSLLLSIPCGFFCCCRSI